MKLKFPVLKKVEYFDIFKNKSLVKSYTGEEINDLTWRELQVKIGTEFDSTVYIYSYKQLNSDEINRGTLVGVNPNKKNGSSDNEIKSLKNQIDNLSKSLNNAKESGGIGVDLLLSVTKQSYETQINFLNIEIQRRENIIDKLETKLSGLEVDLDEALDVNEELKSKTGLNQYLEMAQTFLAMKKGVLKPLENLSDSNTSDVPESILQILGMVDYSRIEKNQLDQIIDWMKIFVQKLPLKSNH